VSTPLLPEVFVPNLDPTDQQLLQIVSATPPVNIPDVIQVMQSIDALLPNNDGLKWFNKLYLMVTQEIDGQPPATAWSDPAWLTGLDVVFAGFYFAAVASFLNDDPRTPSSWDALFEARDTANIDRIQFALAGMNAHINHDLALALIKTNTQMNLDPSLQSPEHDDYQRVNGILADVLPKALTFLATGILGQAAQDTGKIGQLLAIWDVGVARDAAWDFGNYLRGLPAVAQTVALDAQDKVTGLAGRGLLLQLRSTMTSSSTS
jgi:hypothetical protein